MDSSQQASEKDNYIEEREHYKSLISLFEKSNAVVERTYNRVVYVFALVLGFVSAVVFFVTYKSVGELKDSFNAEKKILLDDLAKVRVKLETAGKDIETEAKEVEQRSNASIVEANKLVNQAKTDATSEISRVGAASSIIAKDQANNAISRIMREEKLIPLVQLTAKGIIEPQVQKIVDQEFGVYTKYIDVHMREVLLYQKLIDVSRPPIYPLIDSLMRNGVNGSVREALKEYMLNNTLSGFGSEKIKLD